MKDTINSGCRGNRERKFVCNVCECGFKATPPDIQSIYVGNGKIRFVCACPVCGTDAYSRTEDIKDWVGYENN